MFLITQLMTDLSCCIVAKDVGLVHELCGSNDLSLVQIREKVLHIVKGHPKMTLSQGG